jgi:prolyl-tRNA synthetase
MAAALSAMIAVSSRLRGSQILVRAFVSTSSSPLFKNLPYTNVASTTRSFKRFNQSLRMASTEVVTLTDEQKAELELKIKAKGDEIRALKDSGSDKDVITPLVQELLTLKGQLDPSSIKPKKKKQQQQKGKKQQKGPKQKKEATGDDLSDYITSRSENYSKWYNDIIRVTGLAETSPVRGCMVIKPWGMSLWDRVRVDLDSRIKEHGAENAYFPLLIPKSFLSKEAEHVDGFAKECAVVTHHRLTADPNGEKGLIADPEAELEDPLIIRPTSETMIWHMFKKWIISYRYVSLLRCHKHLHK